MLVKCWNPRRILLICLEGLWTQPCRAKKETHTSNRKLAAEENASHKIPKPIYGCKVESHESTRQRVESPLLTKHNDHIAAKGFTSMTHYNLVHKFIPMPQAMKISDAKAALDKEWKKLETIPAWQLEKVKSKNEVFLEAQRDKQKVHFATLMDICHLKNAELLVTSKAESCSVVTL